jgi:hypothetical protein
MRPDAAHARPFHQIFTPFEALRASIRAILSWIADFVGG